jgi:hypothetical protein
VSVNSNPPIARLTGKRRPPGEKKGDSVESITGTIARKNQRLPEEGRPVETEANVVREVCAEFYLQQGRKGPIDRKSSSQEEATALRQSKITSKCGGD